MVKNVKTLDSYLEDLIYFQDEEDKVGEKALIKSVEGQQVSLSEVGQVLLSLVDDIGEVTRGAIQEQIHRAQELTEYRLKSLVFNLPTDIQEQIIADFKKAEDTLLDDELDKIKEEQEGDKQ